MEINKYRSQLFGIATILVCLVHIEFSQQGWVMQGIHRLCQIGVDIFMLLSGIGCYYSLTKNSIKKFYINRAKRILPVYLIIFISFGLFQVFYWEIPIEYYLYNYSFFSFPLFGIARHWYVFAIIILYAVAPLIYKLLNTRYFWIIFASIILISSQLYFYQIPDNLYVLNELFFCRIPVFLLGFYFGKNNTIKITTGFYYRAALSILLLILESIFNKVNVMGILHYLSIPASVYICCFLIMFFDRFKCNILSIIGLCSFGVYLLQEKLNLIIRIHFTESNFSINIISIIMSFIITFLLEKIFEKVRKF